MTAVTVIATAKTTLCWRPHVLSPSPSEPLHVRTRAQLELRGACREEHRRIEGMRLGAGVVAEAEAEAGCHSRIALAFSILVLV